MPELSQQEINEQMYLFAKRWIDDLPFEESKKTPVMAIAYCLARLSKQDELLKEQEAQNVVNMMLSKDRFLIASCPKCNELLTRAEHKNYCGYCGQAVKWK